MQLKFEFLEVIITFLLAAVVVAVAVVAVVAAVANVIQHQIVKTKII